MPRETTGIRRAGVGVGIALLVLGLPAPAGAALTHLYSYNPETFQRPVLSDSFPAGPLSPQWEPIQQAGGTASIAAKGGLRLSTLPGGHLAGYPGSEAEVASTSAYTGAAAWDAYSVASAVLRPDLLMSVTQETGAYTLQVQPGPSALFAAPDSPAISARIPPAPTYRLRIMTAGAHVEAYVNGRRVARAPRLAHPSVALGLRLQAQAGSVALFSRVLLTVSGARLRTIATRRPAYSLPHSSTGRRPG